MDAFSIVTSVALQYGVPLETFVEKFTNMRFEPAGMTDDPDVRMAQSLMDYVFRRLALDYLDFDTRSYMGIHSAEERARQLETGSYAPVDEETGEDLEEELESFSQGIGASSKKSDAVAPTTAKSGPTPSIGKSPQWHESAYTRFDVGVGARRYLAGMSAAVGHDPGVRHVRTAEEARRLALLLNSTTRRAPVVVISTAAGERDPYADAAEVASTLGDLAEVHVIPTGDVSWEFSSAMPPMTQVYGGASRVYPVDLEWTSSPTRSPLRFAYGARDRDRVTDLLISDAMGMALAAGLVRVPSRQAMVHAAGEVMGVVGSRAMVKTDRGVVTIWPELTVAGVDADRLFAKGMHVAGHLDMAHRRLDVRGSLVPVDQLLTAYPPGATVLGRVARLDAGGCHVELVPGVRAFVKAGDASADDRTPLTSLMTVGETVTARILAVGDANGKGWRLTLVDVDPGEEPTAAALLDGGPPWLAVPPLEQEPVQEDLVPAPVVPMAPRPASELLDVPPMVVSPSEVAGLRAERDGFLTELEAARARIEKLERSREQLRRQAREAVNDADRRRRQVQSLHEEVGRAAQDSTLFLDPADQLDFEVRLAWARRTPASEKSVLALRNYVIGPHFFESWDAVDGIDRRKVVDVLVEVLTGRVHAIAGRETHQLRTSEGGGSPFVSRPDGATCWRVALQVNTPQARRLHYWMRTDGTIELSSVRQHDDVRP